MPGKIYKGSDVEADQSEATDEKKENEASKRRRHASDDSQISVESIEDYIPTPPDGGWGWVIVGASLVCNLIVDGIGYSFGVFLIEFIDVFKESKSKVSLVGSLLCGIYLFCGPIVSAMTNKFGCRPVVIAGSIMATGAFVLATFSPSINFLIFTYGILGGLGLGMIYLPAIVSVGYYFEKKRAFATGLAVCGSGVGTFMFPPLTELLLKLYNWQGALWIISGIIFQGCICGVLMRPLQAKPKLKSQDTKKDRTPRAKNMLDRLKESSHRDRSVSESISRVSTASERNAIAERVLAAKLSREKKLQDNDSDIGSLPSVAFVKRRDSSEGRRSSAGLSIPGIQGKTSVSSQGSTDGDQSISPQSSVQHSPRIVIEMENISKKLQNKTGEGSDVVISEFTELINGEDSSPSTEVNQNNQDKDSLSFGNGQIVQVLDSVDPSNITKSPKNGNFSGGEFSPLLEVTPSHNRRSSAIGSKTHLASMRSLHVSKKDLARPLYRKDIFYSGSVLNMPQFRSQPDMKGYIASITTLPGENDILDGQTTSAQLVHKLCSCLPRSARDILAEMVDLTLFTDISFMLICLGNITAFLGFFVPFMFLVDRATSLGIEKSQAAFLISIIGITNTVGRVAVGKLADLRIVDSLVITYVSLATCGAVTIVTPFCTNYGLLSAVAAIFGLGVAAFISLSSIIICDRMGLEKLTNAFGLMSMVRGISGMAGPPLAGFMYDSTNSYYLSFILSGVMMVFGAGCHVFLHLPCLKPKNLDKQLLVQEDKESGDKED